MKKKDYLYSSIKLYVRKLDPSVDHIRQKDDRKDQANQKLERR